MWHNKLTKSHLSPLLLKSEYTKHVTPHETPTISSFRTSCTTSHFFFFNDTATTEIYTLSLHDALPIYARENIGVLGFGRYSASNWKMLAGDHPMPPKSLTPGRLQVVTDRVRETQGVFMPALEARTLALAGTVTPLPAGMPGAALVSKTPELGSDVGAEQPVVVDDSPKPLAPSGAVTLSEAVHEGIVSCTLHAIRKASQRPGFPPHTGFRGLAKEYDALALAEFDARRRK